MIGRYLALCLPGAPRATLIAAAELALGFGPRCSIDEEHACVMLDISGCGHLVGGDGPLAEQLFARLNVFEREVRLAVEIGRAHV